MPRHGAILDIARRTQLCTHDSEIPKRFATCANVRTHFGEGKTGSATVRRSFAALLREQLGLMAQPRNRAKPGYFANFGISEDGEVRLSEWMNRNLTLSTWPRPSERIVLDSVETLVIREWCPPINVAKNPRKDPRLSAARKRMATDARAWVEVC
ncbi:GIY-YIG nuclease family protein [Agromyces agglutinans]|uniref:GIY-YIG nuclease family protein n=1 Tax=Agromyces agglutinans TaxID=2662258 RepID=UPI0035E4052D